MRPGVATNDVPSFRQRASVLPRHRIEALFGASGIIEDPSRDHEPTTEAKRFEEGRCHRRVVAMPIIERDHNAGPGQTSRTGDEAQQILLAQALEVAAVERELPLERALETPGRAVVVDGNRCRWPTEGEIQAENPGAIEEFGQHSLCERGAGAHCVEVLPRL